MSDKPPAWTYLWEQVSNHFLYCDRCKVTKTVTLPMRATTLSRLLAEFGREHRLCKAKRTPGGAS